MTAAKGQRTICIACDTSEWTLKAIEWVHCNLVQPNDLIILVNVHEKVYSFDRDVINYYKNKAVQVEQVLIKFGGMFPKNTVVIKILDGDVKEELVKYANQLKPELVVVGTRRLCGIQRLFGSSTSDYLAKHLKVPILVCR